MFGHRQMESDAVEALPNAGTEPTVAPVGGHPGPGTELYSGLDR